MKLCTGKRRRLLARARRGGVSALRSLFPTPAAQPSRPQRDGLAVAQAAKYHPDRADSNDPTLTRRSSASGTPPTGAPTASAAAAPSRTIGCSREWQSRWLLSADASADDIARAHGDTWFMRRNPHTPHVAETDHVSSAGWVARRNHSRRSRRRRSSGSSPRQRRRAGGRRARGRVRAPTSSRPCPTKCARRRTPRRRRTLAMRTRRARGRACGSRCTTWRRATRARTTSALASTTRESRCTASSTPTTASITRKALRGSRGTRPSTRSRRRGCRCARASSSATTRAPTRALPTPTCARARPSGRPTTTTSSPTIATTGRRRRSASLGVAAPIPPWVDRSTRWMRFFSGVAVGTEERGGGGGRESAPLLPRG